MDTLFDSLSFFVFYAAAFGLLFGSFLNVVIYRVPKMMENAWLQDYRESFPEHFSAEDTAKTDAVFNLCLPRSHCPSCKNTVKAIDNIPVFSWLWLRGKCRYCQTPISVRYPCIELLTSIMMGITAYHLTGSYWTIAVLLATCALIALCFIDIDHMLLPDQITLPLLWAGLLLSVFGISPIALPNAVMGAACGYLILWSVYQVFKLITGKEGMGYGDFKLLAALGAWVGWQALPLIIILSSFVGIFGGLASMYLQKTGRETPFPFGPYLAIAGWIALVWGAEIMNWYFDTFMGL